MLILSRQSHFSAVSACARLDERLLDVDQTTFSTEIAPVLNSETFQGTFAPTQKFWIASGGKSCRAVDENGHESSVSCSSQLPALCSQSFGDSATPVSRNLINVTSHDTTFTG